MKLILYLFTLQGVEEVFTNESFPTTSLPEMGTDELIPQDRVSNTTTIAGIYVTHTSLRLALCSVSADSCMSNVHNILFIGFVISGVDKFAYTGEAVK